MSFLVGVCVLAAVPAVAQIRSYVDEHGRRVFVNAEPPAPTRTSAPAKPAVRGGATLVRTSSAPSTGRTSTVTKDDLAALAHETAERHAIDPALVRAVIEAESNWNITAVSAKGAQGLMQLVPATAQRLGVADVFDPVQNLDGGVRHLRWLLERYGGDLEKSLAAYNAGEGAVDRARGVPNYSETRAYVQKVVDTYFRPDSGRQQHWWNVPQGIYRLVNEQGRMVFTNQ